MILSHYFNIFLIKTKNILPLKVLIIVPLISVYISGILIYRYLGTASADTFIKSYKVNIILTTTDNITISGKFIGLMKNNYFVLVKNKGIYETYSIREDEVAKAKFMDKLLIKSP